MGMGVASSPYGDCFFGSYCSNRLHKTAAVGRQPMDNIHEITCTLRQHNCAVISCRRRFVLSPRHMIRPHHASSHPHQATRLARRPLRSAPIGMTFCNCKTLPALFRHSTCSCRMEPPPSRIVRPPCRMTRPPCRIVRHP